MNFNELDKIRLLSELLWVGHQIAEKGTTDEHKKMAEICAESCEFLSELWEDNRLLTKRNQDLEIIYLNSKLKKD